MLDEPWHDRYLGIVEQGPGVVLRQVVAAEPRPSSSSDRNRTITYSGVSVTHARCSSSQ
jgi:hypothetical protein